MRYEWGSLDLDTFIQRLREDEGISDAKVEQSSSGYIIHLVSKFILFTLKLIFIQLILWMSILAQRRCPYSSRGQIHSHVL